MNEIEQNPVIMKIIEYLKDNISILAKGIESIVQATAEIVKSQTFQNFANACNRPFLTPKQYHLMLHGKKRVRNKWHNMARKRLNKIMKGENNG